ncbi:MAG: hypothetical protein IJP49_07945 [Bacteroidales bacterium]|nr:hypothetical protein [Bacteroidales bacterium]
MSRRLIDRLWIVAALLLAGMPLCAQNGAYNGYSPYSVYGVGDLHPAGTAYNASMGGVGIATRNKRFVNTMNPASATARDSLSFMADFGLSGKASLFSQDDLRGTKTLLNINDFVISFPMWRKTAFMVGIQPFSDTGFSMSYIDRITSGDQSIGYTGNRAYSAAGDGGINQFFAGASVLLWNRLSLGAQYNMFFGTISKHSSSSFGDASYRSQMLGDTLQIRAHTAKFGLQYEQPIGTSGRLNLGATYRLKAAITGHAIEFSNVSEMDTGSHALKDDKISLGDEMGFGLAYSQGDKWSLEVDYIRSDWTGSHFDAVRGFRNNGTYSFSSSVAQSVRAGFEITPNRNDIRYFFKRCTYRFGGYMDQSYYQVNGQNITSAGITLGMTLPVFQGYNGITFALDLGQRGFGTAFVKEKYIGFHVGFNIFDIWFRKPQYQ